MCEPFPFAQSYYYTILPRVVRNASMCEAAHTSRFKKALRAYWGDRPSKSGESFSLSSLISGLSNCERAFNSYSIEGKSKQLSAVPWKCRKLFIHCFRKWQNNYLLLEEKLHLNWWDKCHRGRCKFSKISTTTSKPLQIKGGNRFYLEEVSSSFSLTIIVIIQRRRKCDLPWCMKNLYF